MTITPKHQNQKPENQNFEETVWFSLKRLFFWFYLCFCGFWWFSPTINLQKTKHTRVFFLVVAFQNQKRQKKNTIWKKKNLLRLNQKVSSKFCFFGFLVLCLLWSFNPCTWPEAFYLSTLFCPCLARAMARIPRAWINKLKHQCIVFLLEKI